MPGNFVYGRFVYQTCSQWNSSTITAEFYMFSARFYTYLSSAVYVRPKTVEGLDEAEWYDTTISDCCALHLSIGYHGKDCSDSWAYLACWMPRFTAYLSYFVSNLPLFHQAISSFRVANPSNSSAFCANPIGKRLDAEAPVEMGDLRRKDIPRPLHSHDSMKFHEACCMQNSISDLREAWSTNPWAAWDQSHHN